MYRILFLILAFWGLLSGHAGAQDASSGQWQHNPGVLKNARVDALLKSHNQISKVKPKSIIPVPDKTAYGFLMDNNDTPEKMGMIAFQLPKPDIYSTIMSSDLNNVVWSGVYVDDVYYAMMVWISASGFGHPTYLASIDLKTGERKNICDITYLDELGGLTALLFTDMTYDYSTSTVYGSVNSGLFETSIYKFSLTDGAVTRVGALDQEMYLVGLACSYDGQMYGMATGGDLYKIDKESCKTTLIGNTGYKPWYIQSMEFDHTDNMLYWAGADSEHTFIARVNTKTAETYEMGTFAPNSQIMGLHIPFTRVVKGAPDKVTEVEIIPEQKGGLSATLTWANPISDPFGSKLTGNVGIKIYRENVLITDIPNKGIGEKCSYTDKSLMGKGNYNYKIVPYNSIGNGEAYKGQSWVGEDYPTTLNNVIAMAVPGGIQVKWETPVNGAHGGWINPVKLKYTVTRMPDNVVVASAISELSYTDRDIKSLSGWRYKVAASDAEGNTSQTNSDSIVAGPGLMPYRQDFAEDNALDLYGVYNLNKDDRSWKVETRSNDKCAMYRYNSSLPADDWLVTPPMKMEAQHRYRISFDLKSFTNSAIYKDKLSVNFGQSSQPQCQKLKLDELVFNNTTWEKYEKEIVVDETTNYYIGLYLHSDKDCGIIGVDNICVEEVFFNDLQAVKVEGAESAITGRISEYVVTIKNKGSRPASSYKVGLADENGKLLSEPAAVAETINPGEIKSFRVKWIPSEVKEQKVAAMVKLDADGDESNDLSSCMLVRTQDPQTIRTATLGKKESIKSYPFRFDSSIESQSQTIYLSSEINSPAALIASLKWYPNFYELGTGDEPVEIYLANTTSASLTDWINGPELILVYKGNVKVEKNQPELVVSLDNLFLYTGGNLCIYVKKLNSKYYSWRDGFYCYSTEGQTSPTLYMSVTPRTDIWKPMVTLQLNSTGAKMSGQVTCGGNPVKDVRVTLKETGQHVETLEDGSYVFDLINTGSYHVSYKQFGYFEVEKEITVSGSEPIVENVSLTVIPQLKVSGQVVNSLNASLGNAKISLKGYQDYQTITDANGRFTIENTYATGKYILNIQADNYAPYNKELDMNVQSGVDLESLKLDEVAYSVYGLSVKENVLNWSEPVQQKECRYDDGKISQMGGFKAQFTSNKSLFGSVYPVSGKITKVKWFVASANGEKQKKVNLFVMKIDGNGKPLGQPVYIEENILSACDGWFEYVLATPVEVTNGFLVGIGSSTESLNIGIDSGFDKEYPYLKNKNFFTSNYETAGYSEAEIYKGNFMIRPTYIDENPAKLPTSGLIDGYKVYRLKQGEEGDKNAWQFLGKVNSLTYTDATLADAGQGYYKYAVSVDWKTAGESQALMSVIVPKDMLTDVTMCITSNVVDKKSLIGSEVSLVCDDGVHKYLSRLQNQDGTLTFAQVHKGFYTIVVSQSRFESFKKQSLDLSENAGYNLGTLTMTERLVAPVNLTVNEKEEGSGTYRLAWNLTSSVFDDFESHPDFTLNSVGTIGWQYIDNDKGKKTYVIEGVQYPNRGAGTAYIVFNPAVTEPRVDTNPEICAWSGDKYLASFSASENANDDYIVSPELYFNEDFELSFYARAFTMNYGMERINVGYSKSDIEPGSFTWLVEADYLNIPSYWTKYVYTVPADAKYVAVRCLSVNAFMLMLDDMQIGSLTPTSYKTYAKSYKVYLDGKCVSSLNTSTYDLAVKGGGTHTVGVEAIYETGVSAMSMATVNLPTSVSAEKADSRYLNYADGKLVFDGEAESIRVFSSTGAVVAGFTEVSESVSLSSLPKGVYMVVADMRGERVMRKIIIR